MAPMSIADANDPRCLGTGGTGGGGIEGRSRLQRLRDRKWRWRRGGSHWFREMNCGTTAFAPSPPSPPSLLSPSYSSLKSLKPPDSSAGSAVQCFSKTSKKGSKEGSLESLAANGVLLFFFPRFFEIYFKIASN